MASRITGITVEINGNVTGLNKALESVNKTIKNTQSQLKDVERLLKLDPTNTQLLTQKQSLFGLTAKDSGHFADILAAASSNANTNVSMMGETFKYAAPIAGALGYSAEDTAMAIG